MSSREQDPSHQYSLCESGTLDNAFRDENKSSSTLGEDTTTNQVHDEQDQVQDEQGGGEKGGDNSSVDKASRNSLRKTMVDPGQDQEEGKKGDDVSGLNYNVLGNESKVCSHPSLRHYLTLPKVPDDILDAISVSTLQQSSVQKGPDNEYQCLQNCWKSLSIL